MGKKADELALVTETDFTGAIDADASLLHAQQNADSVGASLTSTADLLGIEGASADLARERFLAVGSALGTIAQNIREIRSAGDAARAAISRAWSDYLLLPDGALSRSERQEIEARPSVRVPGHGVVPGDLAAGLISGQQEAKREAEAASALAALDLTMNSIVPPVPDVWGSGGGDGGGGTNTPTYRPGTLSGGSGADYSLPSASAATGTGLGLGAAAVAPSLIGGSGVGSAGSVIGGGSGKGGSGSSGSTSGGGKGSGTNGGTVYTPGHGDGSSSDGSTVGTLPGTGGSAGGGSWGSGSGAGGALGGVGAGGIASGLMVGGAALGAGKLGGARGGAGGLGGSAGGLGTLGGIGGGTGGSAGGAAGTTSMIGGTTSSLAQGAQTGATGAGASGSRTGTSGGMPMGGGSGGAGGQSKDKRRGSAGLLAPDLGVEDDAPRPDLGAGARAGGRDSLPTPAAQIEDLDDDTW